MSAIQQLLTDHIDIWTAAETEKRSGRGRASTNAARVYGIVKLRELILTLAVCGKLIPQDPSDESAGSLIQKIQKHKAKLISEGKIAKEKQLPAITESEKSFNLPLGWDWVRFCDYATDIATGPFGSMIHQADYIQGGVPLINPSHMINDKIVPDESTSITHDLAKTLRAYAIYDGDIVMARRGEVGRIALVTKNESGWLCGTGSFVLRFHEEIPRNYLKLLFRSESVRSFLVGESVGTTMVNLNHGILKKMPIGIPPLAEQHRIVAKVDELMALCDQLEAQHSDAADAHEQLVGYLLGTLTQSQGIEDFNSNWRRLAAHFDTLFTTDASIDALKQTLLQLAVMGKLVAQDANDEPASELLKRIQAEKEKSVSEGKIKKEKLLVVVDAEERRYSAPTGWEWVRFNVIAQTRLGKMLDQAKNKGVFRPYLRNTNVQWNRFELDDLKEMRFENHELDEYRLNAGDLVICEGGEPGRSAVWENQLEDMFIQKALHRARTWPGVSPYYLNIHLRVDAETGYLKRFFTGATIKHFPGEKLALYSIALPPASEQVRILARLNELMALCDQLQSRIINSNQHQKKLADVLVEQATGKRDKNRN